MVSCPLSKTKLNSCAMLSKESDSGCHYNKRSRTNTRCHWMILNSNNCIADIDKTAHETCHGQSTIESLISSDRFENGLLLEFPWCTLKYS